MWGKGGMAAASTAGLPLLPLLMVASTFGKRR